MTYLNSAADRSHESPEERGQQLPHKGIHSHGLRLNVLIRSMKSLSTQATALVELTKSEAAKPVSPHPSLEGITHLIVF